MRTEMGELRDHENELMDPSESTSSNDGEDDKTGFSGTSTSLPGESCISAEEDARRMAIIAREEQHVRKARRTLAAAIFICASAVSAAVYFASKQNEYNTFVKKFQIFSTDVIAYVQWQTDYNFRLLQQLSADITSTAILQQAVFPNVTHPHFEISAGYADGFGGILSTLYAPIIPDSEHGLWENYARRNTGWVDESLELRIVHPGHLHQTHEHYKYQKTGSSEDNNGTNKHNVSEYIFRWDNGNKVPEAIDSSKNYAPLWQVTPPESSVINFNLFSDSLISDLYSVMIAMNSTVQSKSTKIDHLFDFVYNDGMKERKQHPHTIIAEPVYNTFSKNGEVVGVILSIVPFLNLFDDILDENAKGIFCVVTDNCGTMISYEINGPSVAFIGYGDLHDPKYDKFERTANLELYESIVDGLCFHEVHIYPTSSFSQAYFTKQPAVSASIVALSFFLMAILVFIYDQMVTKRQEKTMKSALRSGALVASLFPANVRDRLMDEIDTNAANQKKRKEEEKKNEMMDNVSVPKARPIADFFPSTTIMFADISGFTAWSSTREAHQVFELLETIYGALDKIAKKRRIFKVETVGDCYVAICGVPTPRDDHAVAMARFASECLAKMNSLTKELEVTLGPDTAALAFRIGLHSGPVTGGVLRGDNARFQLFGDTVNTTSRMESTGLPNRIHVSQDTANLLIEASKEHWVTARDELVSAKGKGLLQTYWLSITDSKQSSRSSGSHFSTSSHFSEEGLSELDEKSRRLAEWNTDILFRFLKCVVAKRGEFEISSQPGEDWTSVSPSDVNILEEVVEIIDLPDLTLGPETGSMDSINLDECVREQLYDYVISIAQLYRNNPFHNFEHAAHVTMSVVKLLGRIGPPADNHEDRSGNRALALHDYSYGITSDPLIQFACVFAALIHDVDHSGVPNTQLVKEKATIAEAFHGKSVAEQNSVVVAWNLLMEPKYASLRRMLCVTIEEAKRFRQLVVNAVMATDVMASDLKALRDRRWAQAFLSPPLPYEAPSETMNRKATIVIEHLIQASDVCHTMQHWHVYRQWNERLFLEMLNAYAEGRAESNPADIWYKGEMGFFDFYVIPLAKKLADCGVFGVSSDEYLNYARKNRDEWEARGEEIVCEMVKKFQSQDS